MITKHRENRSTVLIITTHPFWAEPLGCGSLMRDRCALLSTIFDEVFTLYLTKSDDKCPLRGGTIRYDGTVSDELCHTINGIVKNYEVDVCYFSYLQDPRLVSSLESFNVVEIHDVLHLRENSFNKFGAESVNKIDENYELSCLMAFDCIFCLNLNEVKYLEANGIDNISWLPPIADIPEWHKKPKLERRAVGFLGSCSQPNLHGFRLIEGLINRSRDFHIAGPISISPDIHPRVIANSKIYGVLTNVSDFYAAVDLVVSPIQFGAGLKIKVYEALRYGVGILATEHSIGGFPTGIRDIISVNDEPENWSLELIEESMNYDKRKIRSYMDEYFSLERGEKIIRDALNL